MTKTGRTVASVLLGVGTLVGSVLGFGLDVLADHPELVAIAAGAAGAPWAGPLASGVANEVRKRTRSAEK